MADDRTIRICPGCGSTRWRKRTNRHGTASDPECPYKCWDCGGTFHTPDERASRANHRGGTHRAVDDDAIDAARRALGIEVED